MINEVFLDQGLDHGHRLYHFGGWLPDEGRLTPASEATHP